MPADLNIIVTCTKRKTREVRPALMLRDIPASDVKTKARAWQARLEAADDQRVRARDLYAGDHWRVAMGLPNIAQNSGFRTRLWIISTGYGLISEESRIAPYSATFSPTHPDSVGGGGQDSFAEWWKYMAAWEGPAPKGPRTLKALVDLDPKASLLVIASAAYLTAVRPDLEAASEVLHPTAQLLVISAGTEDLGTLGSHLLPADARLQRSVGGARRSLNVRVARKVLEEVTPSTFKVDAISARWRRRLVRQPVIESPHRAKSTEAQVVAFIRQQLRLDPAASFTRLLRDYRNTNRACEQSRFRSLFGRIKAQERVT